MLAAPEGDFLPRRQRHPLGHAGQLARDPRRLALREIQRRPCDVVILDIEMPVMDGLTVLPKLIAAAPGVKVLM